METNLLYYLWKDKFVSMDDLLVSLNGTTDIRQEMSAFKAIKHMLQDINKPLPIDYKLPYTLPTEKRIIDFMWYSPKELNLLQNSTQPLCLVVRKDKEYVLDQNVRIYDQVKQHGLLDAIQRHPKQYTLQTCTQEPSKPTPRVFLGDTSDVESDGALSDAEYYDFSDEEDICFSNNYYKPLCKSDNVPKDVVREDPFVMQVETALENDIPSFFGGTDAKQWVYFPYFETFEDREEASTLLHYYKSKAEELGIDAMKPDKSFIVDKELDKFYDDLYAMSELKTKVKEAIEELDKVVAEGTYHAWDLWEESFVNVKAKLHAAFTDWLKGKTKTEKAKLKKKTEAERAYKVKWLEDTYVTWLSTYKQSNYVPLRFLRKYFN